MASSLISRSHHIDFDSVFRFDDAGIVQMFETLVSTGLMEFLGCPAIFHEHALIKLFANGSVRDGMVVSVIGGMAVEISESVFAMAFGLPTEGLTDLSEVPRNLLSDAQRLFSASEKEVSISCLKKEVKMKYRLLSDILAKSLFVKAGSFDAVTRDRFLLMIAITFDVKVNWGNLLFGVLKEMVTPDSRQAKGYAIQICVLLKNIPGLELGESKAFPAPRILNEKTVHSIVSVNENVGVEEVGDAPRAKTTPVKRTVYKKRPASVDVDVAPVIKNKRTAKSKPVAAKKLVLEEPIAAVPSTEEQIPVKEIATEDADATIRQVLTQLDLVLKNKMMYKVVGLRPGLIGILMKPGTMEVGDSSKQTVGSKRSFEELLSVDDLLVQICDDMMLPSITDAEISKIRIGESIVMHDTGKGILVEDEPVQRNPAQETVELICGDVEFLVDLRDQTDSLETAVKRRLYILARYREMLLRKFLDSHPQYLVSGQPWTTTASQIFDLLSAVHSKSLEALRIQQQEHGIIFEQPCTSTAFDYAVDCGAVFAQFFSVARSTCWVRPMIFVDGIWTPLQGPGFWRSGCRLSLFLNKVEMPAPAVQDIFVPSILFIEPVQYWGAAPSLPKTWAWHRVCSEATQFSMSGRLRPAILSSDIVIRNLGVERLPDYFLDEFEHGVNTGYFADFLSGSSGTIFQDLIDIKKNQRAQEAKLNALDGQVAALRNDQLEFQNRISADLLSLSTQFADIVEFIRGGDAKKGESGSSSHPPPVRVERRPLPTPQSPRDVAGGSSAVRIPTFPRTTGTFAERVEQARRHLLESGLVISVEEAAERIRQADFQESDRFQRERERARREKRSSSYRRRRGF
ncbi:hypothetical protein F511_40491 [Dorcoceras hygrometricum]|uniref:Dystroglycan-like n=1 Tax=Dorcoceras hygrometricum TaxID=472368 RepID=A0A2Z7CQ95_9LAMI|nr:hypothetical protein F511_40491 [Dorcoceras hygrometricum]